MQFNRLLVIGAILVVVGIGVIAFLFVSSAVERRTPMPTPIAQLAKATPSVAVPTHVVEALQATPTPPPPSPTATVTPSRTSTIPTTNTSSAPTATPTLPLAPVATLASGEMSGCGSLVAYVRDSGLWLMNADGSNQRELTRGAKGHPAWSPDGLKVTFSPAIGSGLRIIDLTTGRGRIIAEREGCFARDPAWSPDGRTIAYRRVCSPDENAAGVIVLLNIEDGSASLDMLLDASSPTWSPDGLRFAVVQGVFGRWPDTSILICEHSGTACSPFSDRDYVQSISWSPSGQYIAAAVVGDPKDDAGAAAGAATPKIRLLPIAGQAERELTGTEPSWSPDSMRILRTAGRYGLAIYVVDIGGTKYQQLAPGASPEWQPCARGR